MLLTCQIARTLMTKYFDADAAPVLDRAGRILREIRRRTRVVGAFPDGQSALNLAAARLRHCRHQLVDQTLFEH
jgi:hypothetical protein